jgi:dinuclear metal center YbgI/SA1388 family protein
MTVERLLEIVDKHFPLALAMDWDNCGLQIGNPSAEVKKILLCLDVSLETVKEALQKGCNAIVSHHPLFFKEMKRIDFSQPIGEIVLLCARENISILSFHTNVDAAEGGLADYVASKLDLTCSEPLEESGIGRICSTDPVDIDLLIEKVCNALQISGSQLRLIKGAKKTLQKIALCPGSGGDLIKKALEIKADCYITGDVKFHQAQEAFGKMWVIDAGHYHTEKLFCELMRGVLEKEGLTCVISETNTNPFIETGGGYG